MSMTIMYLCVYQTRDQYLGNSIKKVCMITMYLCMCQTWDQYIGNSIKTMYLCVCWTRDYISAFCFLLHQSFSKLPALAEDSSKNRVHGAMFDINLLYLCLSALHIWLQPASTDTLLCGVVNALQHLSNSPVLQIEPWTFVVCCF